MNMGGSFWLKHLVLSVLIFGLAVVLLVVANEVLLLPLLRWVFLDEWRWSPSNERLRFVVLGAFGGVLTGALFTNYQWLVHTSSSLTRKVVTTTLVVAIYITLLVVLREWIGKMLPG